MSEDRNPHRNPSIDETFELVRQAKRGDEAALGRLLVRYQDRVLAIARARLGARVRRKLESGDIAQEALLRALKAFDAYETRDDAKFIAWLARIVEHTILNEARRLDRGSVGLLEDKGAPSASAKGSGPWMGLERAEQRGSLQAAMDQLPEHYREIIHKRAFEQLAWKDIVEELSLRSPGAAQMLYSRAVRSLGRTLRVKGMDVTSRAS